ncbi:Domain of unknown function DUF306, Meta/HslJ [Methylophilaceae bacterium]
MTHQFKIILLYLFILLTISACVPVLIVGLGATAGSKVTQENTEANQVIEKNEPIKTEANQVIEKNEPIKTESVVQKTAAAEPLPKASLGVDEPMISASQANINSFVLIRPNSDISELHNIGWQITLISDSEMNDSDSVLFLNDNKNYFGFDGCRYFNGRYESKVEGRLLIKSLNVSDRNLKSCENKISTNLIMVDSFSKVGNTLTLHGQGKELIKLTPKVMFDKQAFLRKARFNNHRTTVPANNKKTSK